MLLITTLQCNVSVATKKKSSPTAKTAGATNPSNSFKSDTSGSSGQTAAPASGNVPEGPNQGSTPSSSPSAGAGYSDPKAIADKVYELMRDEIRLARLRRGG